MQRQESVVDAFPTAPASLAFRDIVRKIGQWQAPQGPRGHVEFFTERLVAAQGSACA